MDNENISRLQELGLNQEQIDVLMVMLEKTPTHGEEVSSSIQDIKDQMKEEQDYTKRAAMAAKIISLSLEQGEY